MGQQYRVVNLDKKQVLDPKLLGSSRVWESFAFTDSPVMGGLLWLLSNDWSGDRVVIVGNHAVETDLPDVEEVCGIPVSQLCFPTQHGHERFKSVSKKVREALARSYGYRFEVRDTTTATATGSGTGGASSLSVNLLAAGTEAMDEASVDTEPFVVINHDLGEFIHSSFFCRDPELRWSISNPWSNTGEHSWIPTALAVLMSTSMDHQSEFFLDDFSGEWAGSRISIKSFSTADLAGLHDLSSDLLTALVSTDAIDDLLTPVEEEPETEEDWSA